MMDTRELFNKTITGIRVVIEPKILHLYTTDPDKIERRLRQEAQEIRDDIMNVKSLAYHYVSTDEEYDWTCPFCVYSWGEQPPKSLADWDCCDEALDEVDRLLLDGAK